MKFVTCLAGLFVLVAVPSAAQAGEAVASGGSQMPVPPPPAPMGMTESYPPEVQLNRFGRQPRFPGPVPDAFHDRHAPRKILTDPVHQEPNDVPLLAPGAMTAVFDTPAAFPLPGFTPLGAAFAKPGAVIYEGMTVTIEPSGRYEVRYLVESPKTPVIVRMQLILHEKGRPVGTLTLPPATIDVERGSSPSQVPSAAYLVRQHGFSHQLRRLLAGDPSGQGTSILRTGTARFGGVPF